MSSLVAILVLMGIAAVYSQDFDDPQTFINQLTFTDSLYIDAFSALNIDSTDNLITDKDLDKLFYHGDAKFAKEKFLGMVDTKPGGVTNKELAVFMNKEPVKLAVHDCIYVRSKALRRVCFGDQILTYVYLVLDQDTVNVLFKALDSKLKDNKLDMEEIKALKTYDEKFNDEAAKYFIKEIGRGRDTIDQETFSNYVKREDLNDNFRECKNDATKTTGYDETCLIKGLMHYIMYDVTEYMTAIVFSFLNKKVMDYNLSKEDIKFAFGTDEDKDSTYTDRFFEIIDNSKDDKITYGEFRTYFQSHSVKLHLERACLRGDQVKPWHENRLCLKRRMYELIKQNHRPIPMVVPDLDMLFLFEELDHSNDGKIGAEEDLVKKRQWDENKAQKFVEEINGSRRPHEGEDRFVTLDEFNYYVDEPNMVYGFGDCLIREAGNTRLDCYVEELEKILLSVLNKGQVKDLRMLYQENEDSEKWEITKKELIALNMEDTDEINNFLRVLGMGDETITEWEFTWFIKQQELSNRFKSDIKNDQLKLHNELRDYLKDTMTEYDIDIFFRRLDKHRNQELEREDFGNVVDAKVLEHISFLGTSGRVSFLEFWLFLNTYSKLDKTQLRKRKLETECTQAFKFKKDPQLECYERTIKTVQ